MPVTYTIDCDQRIIRTACVGNVTLQEVIDHLRTLHRDPSCPDHLKVLLGLSGTNSLPESPQITVVSDEIGKLREKVCFEECAVVASRGGLFGMMRIFEVMAQEYFRVIRVFRVTTEAEEWLISQPCLIEHDQ